MKAPTRAGRTPGVGSDLAMLARIRAVPVTEIARRSGLGYQRASLILRDRRRPTPAEVRAIADAILADAVPEEVA